MPKCPKAASGQQQFHVVLTSTGLSSDMTALNVFSCIPSLLDLRIGMGFDMCFKIGKYFVELK